jgi:predicted ATP-grasp superfamily ATP-dependent carboligase
VTTRKRGELNARDSHGKQAPGAIVVGGDYQGLGIVRSLGRLGVRVSVIDDERSIARFSRFATTATRVADLYNEDTIVSALLAASGGAAAPGDVVFATRDEIVAAISRNRDALAAVYRVPTPPWESIHHVWDKRQTYELARALEIPTPRTVVADDDRALERLELDYPVVVKPAVKERFIRATRAKAWRADSPAELAELVDRAHAIVPAAETMVQELIPGSGESQYAYCAFFKDGEAVLSLFARRRRQHPWEFGRASTFVETVPDAPELEEYSLRFLRAIDYYGLVELEYKYDARDGRFKLLDVNARTWGYHTLGTAAGVDFSAALYSDQVGRAVERKRARPGVSWVRLMTDLPTGAADVLAGRVRLGPYVRSVRAADTEAVWDRRDIRPWFAELALLPYLAVKRGF